jgi:flagellar protein FliO/FliZ
MSALSSLGEKPFIIAAVAICFFVAAVLIWLIFRLAFGRRLRMAGGRGRQLRLGIVDAFDLDRQRQLVIVRRDNTEHLIMIGGPNDILIESQIVRAEARDSRETRGREKEPRDKDAKEIRDKDIKPVTPPKPAEPKLPPATPMPPLTPLPPVSPVIPEPQQPAAQEIAAAMRLQPVSRAPVPPAAAPPRRTPSRPDIKPLPEPPVRVEPELPAAAFNPPPPKPAAAPTNAPGFLRWPARPAPSFKPSTDVIPPPPATESSPHEPSQVPDPMESLEEEMAKLLGRGPNKP